jgi:hypothetical protein
VVMMSALHLSIRYKAQKVGSSILPARMHQKAFLFAFWQACVVVERVFLEVEVDEVCQNLWCGPLFLAL